MSTDREYICTCRKLCHGASTVLPKSTWHRHNPKPKSTLIRNQPRTTQRSRQPQASRTLVSGFSSDSIHIQVSQNPFLVHHTPSQGSYPMLLTAPGSSILRQSSTKVPFPVTPNNTLLNADSEEDGDTLSLDNLSDRDISMVDDYIDVGSQERSQFDDPHDRNDDTEDHIQVVDKGDIGTDVEDEDIERPEGSINFGGIVPEDDVSDNEEPFVPPDEPDSDIDVEEFAGSNKVEEWKFGFEVIEALRNAKLDDAGGGLSREQINLIRHPKEFLLETELEDDPNLRLGLDIYLSLSNSSQRTYTDIRTAILRRFPLKCSTLPTLSQVRSCIANLSGVQSIVHDMCINSCVGYTGPYAELMECPVCGEPRYDPNELKRSKGRKKVPRYQFHTIPLAQQLQALRRNPESSERFRYSDRKYKELFEEIARSHGSIETYDDVFTGKDFLEARQNGKIKDGDPILMLSLDGAQLYRNKDSDCWIYIWVIFNIAPGMRYKKVHVLPGGFIPGPNNPKVIESFLFPGFHHLASLQNEGLKVWDAKTNRTFTTYPFLALATADGPGMAYINGTVGHHGRSGCRLFCGMKGRRGLTGSHYYPALLKPHNYTVEGSDHADINPIALLSANNASSTIYQQNLQLMSQAADNREFAKLRLETGISKPTILLGLRAERMLGVPKGFGSDIMHVLSLNIPTLQVSLLRGTIRRYPNDPIETWDWAVFRDPRRWKAHGKAVANAQPYLPGSFDRPPRNIQEKLTSGYKAWEFLIYLYGLCPGILYGILPQVYWEHFCRLVAAVRIVSQYQIRREDLRRAHQYLVLYCKEYENLYYQRKPERVHFVRPCLHSLLHLAPEIQRVGPGICSSQWTMERAIGSLGSEIRQPSNPFANLSQRGVARAQNNALKVMCPNLGPEEPTVATTTIILSNGFSLMRPRSRYEKALTLSEASVLRRYLQINHGTPFFDADELPKLYRWSRVELPNGQIARTAWKELERTAPTRSARNVKVIKDGQTSFHEVLFFLYVPLGPNSRTGSSIALAVTSKYSEPDSELWKLSSGTLWSCMCTEPGEANLQIVAVTDIKSVVAMVPYDPYSTGSTKHRFVVEKPGLECATLGGTNERAEGRSGENGDEDKDEGENQEGIL